MASLSTCHLGLWLGWQIFLNLVKSCNDCEIQWSHNGQREVLWTLNSTGETLTTSGFLGDDGTLKWHLMLVNELTSNVRSNLTSRSGSGTPCNATRSQSTRRRAKLSITWVRLQGDIHTNYIRRTAICFVCLINNEYVDLMPYCI